MASKNENKRPPSSQIKYSVSEVSVGKRRRIGNPKMEPNTGAEALTRQPFSVVNWSQDLPPTSGLQSNSGSDSGVVEFSKEEVEALLNEKLRIKNKFNYKEKSEQMGSYIRRLKQCIKSFQQREVNNLAEVENTKDLLELVEKKSSDIELQMKAKEDEFNSVVMESRKNSEVLQEKLRKEEADKLELRDSLCIAEEARLVAERSLASLSEDLKRLQQDFAYSKQKNQSIENMYRGLQEYNTSLQQYNTKLHSDVDLTNVVLKRVEEEKASVVDAISKLRAHNASLQEQLSSSRASQEAAVKQKEALGSEVTSLRIDLQQVREDRDRLLLHVQALSSDVQKV